jgi:hypothetical protein
VSSTLTPAFPTKTSSEMIAPKQSVPKRLFKEAPPKTPSEILASKHSNDTIGVIYAYIMLAYLGALCKCLYVKIRTHRKHTGMDHGATTSLIEKIFLAATRLG